MGYDRLQRSHMDARPASSAPNSTVLGVPSPRLCCHLCNLDDGCYAVVAIKQEEVPMWTCELYDKLLSREVFVASPGSNVYQSSLNVVSVDLW